MEKIVCKCPLCGMTVGLGKIEEGPYESEIFLQEFGGKIAGIEKGRGKAKGIIKYTRIEDDQKQQRVMKLIRRKLKEIK